MGVGLVFFSSVKTPSFPVQFPKDAILPPIYVLVVSVKTLPVSALSVLLVSMSALRQRHDSLVIITL